MKDAPTISLIIVNQDRREELARLLSALRFQRLMPSEIIVVSNLSENERPKTSLEIIWLPSPEAGISAARNTGIAKSSGEIVAFCDDDAVPEFGWLAHLTEPLVLRGVASSGGYVRGRNGVSFQSRTVFFDRYGRDWEEKSNETEARIYPPDKDTIPKTVGTNCAFRRDALCQIGGFDEAYQFFLDEADVNIRLSDAGRQAAIIPKAEVHHGYAASRRRSARRVPEGLFEIGASKAHFCQQFANLPSIDKLLPEFIAEQDARLRRLHHFGLVNAPRYRDLMQELSDGIENGRVRNSKLVDMDEDPEVVLPSPEAVERPKTLVLTNHRQRRRASAQALQAVEAGHEVTVFLIEYTIRPLRVWFETDGFWVHRIGILGRDERHHKARAAKSATRIKREIHRIEAQRQLCAENVTIKDFR